MNRNGWRKKWKSIMDRPTEDPDLDQLKTIPIDDRLTKELNIEIPNRFKISDKNFQKGGESKAWALLGSFMEKREQRGKR